MFDDLRNIADDQSAFADDRDSDLEPLLKKKARSGGQGFKISNNTFLGMNAFQRFVISALVFVLVCMLGILLLVIRSSAMVF
jgi:hypothetical protein